MSIIENVSLCAGLDRLHGQGLGCAGRGDSGIPNQSVSSCIWPGRFTVGYLYENDKDPSMFELEDLTLVVISYEIYETSLWRVL